MAIRRFPPNPVRWAVAGLLLCSVLLLGVAPARAVLFYWTGDPSYNTNAPTKTLANSGWQYQGAWAGFSGTVISSNCFITAKHVSGVIGHLFLFQGVGYWTTAHYDDPDSDLSIWRVAGRFPTNAPLYTKGNERGKTAVVIGRGTERGTNVVLNGKLKGWLWGAWTSVQRWGQNKISAIAYGGSDKGWLLRASFDFGAGRNEADLSGGDSGGAVFIKDGRFYKLAGINYGVDGPYNTTNSPSEFDAALFDERGFYVTNSAAGGWTLIPPRGGRVPGGFYATRISSRIGWITNIVAMPAP